MSMRTKGTQLFYFYLGHWLMFGCPKSITGLGGAASEIDETCLDSEEMEKSPGMPNPGPLSVTFDLDWAKQSHRDFDDLFEAQTKIQFAIGYSDGPKTAVPTANSAGVTTWPATRSFTEFTGYIADLPEDFAVNANVTSNGQIQRSGPRIRHLKALS